VRSAHFRTSPPPPVTDMKTRTKLRLLIGIAGVALTTAALMAVPALGIPGLVLTVDVGGGE
jgi:hypothetical protein